MSLKVLEPGLCSLIVDDGRPRTRELGVPVGGPADRCAWQIGNALLGNPPNSAALEITLVGPVLVAAARVGCVLFGAPFTLSTGQQRLAVNRTFTLEDGEELHIGGAPQGARAYLCVVGGFQTPTVLGSRSGLAPIQRGDELPCRPSSAPRRYLTPDFCFPGLAALSPDLNSKLRVLRVITGPEANWFPFAIAELGSGSAWASFTVRPDSNRMGLRLAGHPLPVPDREMVSQPVAPGTIQVTLDGQMIVLGVDGQSIGGYPRFANVISVDLDLVGQLRPGDRVSLLGMTLDEAEGLASAKRTLVRAGLARLQTACGAF
jgi:5-oxoprolinase (ATP-hydrolysing) subunit C